MGINLRSIAEKAGVSVSTVSNALNGRSNVGEKTRRKILLIAREMGYKKAIPRGKRRRLNIGIIFPRTGAYRESPSEYVNEMICGIEEVLRQEACNVLISSSSEDGDEEVMSFASSETVDGLIIAGSVFTVHFMKKIKKTGIPLVLAGPLAQEVDVVFADYEEGACLVTKHLLSHGYRRVVFVNGPPTTQTSSLKFAGYKKCMKQHGLTPECLGEGDFTMESGLSIGRKILAGIDRPEAILVADDSMAIGVIRAAHELNIRVPDEVAVAGIGNISSGRYIEPQLTTVDLFKEKVGKLAAQRLVEIIGGDRLTAVKTTLVPRVVTRGSCGCRESKGSDAGVDNLSVALGS